MSTSAIPVHVGLVDETGEVGDLAGLAGALNEQVQADFAPVWHVRASVGAYTKDSLPAGCWAVRVVAKLDEPGALGYHTDHNRQPFALVELTADVDKTVSHELLEMLADPFGSRTHQADLPVGLESQYGKFGLHTSHSRVNYLVEVCDPCEETGYAVGGRMLSDFLLPLYYRTTPVAGAACSHALGVIGPREVAAGGYVSFEAPVGSGHWWQAFGENGQLSVQDLGTFAQAEFATLREFTDFHARAYRAGKR